MTQRERLVHILGQENAEHDIAQIKKLIERQKILSEEQDVLRDALQVISDRLTSPRYIELKSKRIQLVLQPSVVDGIKTLAIKQGISMNEAFSLAAQEYLNKYNG